MTASLHLSGSWCRGAQLNVEQSALHRAAGRAPPLQRRHAAAAAAVRPVLAAGGATIEELRKEGAWPQPDSLKGNALARRVEEAFADTFWGATAAPRVLDSFLRLQAGEEFVKEWPGLGLQHANSYIKGLTPQPFPDVHGGAYPWLEGVEAAAGEILAEYLEMTADDAGLVARGNSIWVPAVRAEALPYGPDWRTLVLQDRGEWEPTNSRLFPRTTRILQNLNAPTLEVFFARQKPRTGIKSHTDFVNFVQTSHLGLDIPEGDCWIKVGEHTRPWANGKVITMDTSFMHETANNTDQERVVLIMRHFHPEVTPLEQRALKFLFDCLDNPTPEGIKAAQRRAKELAAAAAGAGKKKGKKGGKAGGTSGGAGFGGFGKKAGAR